MFKIEQTLRTLILSKITAKNIKKEYANAGCADACTATCSGTCAGKGY